MKQVGVDTAKQSEPREVRRKSVGRVQCPRCSKWVTLWAETEEWTQTRTGKWKHSSYGPGAAECCNLAMLDSLWDGLIVFKLDQPYVARPARGDHD